MAITIVLSNGPEAGREMTIPQHLWNQGTIRIPERSSLPLGNFQLPYVFTYGRQKYAPEWASFCAMPLHLWVRQ